MSPETRSGVSSERQNWEHIFKAMTQIVQEQQSKLETMAKDRKLLANRLRSEHEKWAFKFKLLRDEIAQLETDLMTKDMEGSVEVAKLEMLLGLKEREASLIKIQKDDMKSDLDDFVKWVELHTKESSDLEGDGEKSRRKRKEDSGTKLMKTPTGDKRLSRGLEDDVKRLQKEYEKLALEKKIEVSALLSEKKFIWNQYNNLEKEFSGKLKNKQSEVEQANEKVKSLLDGMEQLQSINKEKDDKIASLEIDSTKLKEENLKLLTELETLRKSAAATPVLKHCSAGARTYNLRGKNSVLDRSNVTVKKESSAAQLASKNRTGGSSSKRNAQEVITIEDTPKLFSVGFKVPKLKNHRSGSKPRHRLQEDLCVLDNSSDKPQACVV